MTENIAVGTTVVRVAASDRDIGDNAAISYFLGSTSQSVYGDLFSVDEMTGDVVVTGEVDHERAAVYHVTVGARDAGAEPLVAEATVVIKVNDVNDNAPTVTVNTLTASNTDVASVSEDVSTGTFVGHVIVTDPDRGASGRFNCSVVGDGGQFFRLQRMFGAEYHLVTSSPLDRERQASYELGVECADSGPECLSSVKWLRVDVTDVNDNAPSFDEQLYTAEIYENNYSGRFVVQVRVSIATTSTKDAVFIGSRAAKRQAALIVSRRVCLFVCVCVSATLMLNISETKRLRGSCLIGTP